MKEISSGNRRAAKRLLCKVNKLNPLSKGGDNYAKGKVSEAVSIRGSSSNQDYTTN